MDFLNNFTYLFIFGCAGCVLMRRLFSSCSEQWLLFIALWRLLTAAAFLFFFFFSGFSFSRAQAWGHVSMWAQWLRFLGSRAQGPAVVVLRLSCSAACGIFLDQGLNPCLLHWQVDSLPLSHQGSPANAFLNLRFICWFALSFQGQID